jgi:hypothetical protein
MWDFFKFILCIFARYRRPPLVEAVAMAMVPSFAHLAAHQFADRKLDIILKRILNHYYI